MVEVADAAFGWLIAPGRYQGQHFAQVTLVTGGEIVRADNPLV